jgi:hypothetical protein
VYLRAATPYALVVGLTICAATAYAPATAAAGLANTGPRSYIGAYHCNAAARSATSRCGCGSSSTEVQRTVMTDEAADRPLQPMVEVSPAACAEVRRALNFALTSLEKRKIKLSLGGWIQDAGEWLDHVATTGSLGQTTEELERTSAAIALAVDLYHISTCFSEDAHRQVAVELAHLARGRLLGRGDSAPGRDYLTQFWIGALLAQSKLQPHIIAYDVPGRPKPDFVITKGGVQFSIEVKRPRSKVSAERATLAAAAQLRALGEPGIIIIDATECMSIGPFQVVDAGSNTRELVRSELHALQRDLFALAASYRRSNKFSDVCMLITIARYWNWVVNDVGPPRRDAGLLFNAYAFPYLLSRQVTQLTGDIQKALLIGVEQLTGNPPAYSQS